MEFQPFEGLNQKLKDVYGVRDCTLQRLTKGERASSAHPVEPGLKIIYVWAECPGCIHCQEDLEELENEVEQM